MIFDEHDHEIFSINTFVYPLAVYIISNSCLLTAFLGSTSLLPASSCKEIKDASEGLAPSGRYWLDLGGPGDQPFDAFCDMEKEGNSPLQKLQREWVQALDAVISGFVWVEKRWLFMIGRWFSS